MRMSEQLGITFNPSLFVLGLVFVLRVPCVSLGLPGRGHGGAELTGEGASLAWGGASHGQGLVGCHHIGIKTNT